MNKNEREIEYGIPYGNHIAEQSYIVDFDACFENKVNSAFENKDVANSIIEYCKKAYTDNKGTKYESMYVIDFDSGGLIAFVDSPEDKIENGVPYTKEFIDSIEKAKSTGKRILAIHNHPSGYPPSPDDFRKAFDNDYEDAIVIGHNGQLYRYNNKEQYLDKENCDDIQLLIKMNYYSGFDIDRAFTEAYNGFGLSYQIL